jgi:hypothetical protein
MASPVEFGPRPRSPMDIQEKRAASSFVRIPSPLWRYEKLEAHSPRVRVCSPETASAQIQVALQQILKNQQKETLPRSPSTLDQMARLESR